MFSKKFSFFLLFFSFTTQISIRSSDGIITIFGDKWVKSLGVCYQNNVLIPHLLVQEHFELFGEFRGLSKETLQSSIDYILTNMQFNTFTEKLSRWSFQWTKKKTLYWSFITRKSRNNFDATNRMCWCSSISTHLENDFYSKRYNIINY